MSNFLKEVKLHCNPRQADSSTHITPQCDPLPSGGKLFSVVQRQAEWRPEGEGQVRSHMANCSAKEG